MSELAQQTWKILAGGVMSHGQSEKVWTITYGDLAERLGQPPHFAQTLGPPLTEIGEFCLRNNLPPLNVIVVRKDTGMPSGQVVLRPESTIEQDQRGVGVPPIN